MNLSDLINSLNKGLADCEAALDRIQLKLEANMAKLQDFKDLLAAVDAETDRIAAKIDELVAKLTTGGMTDAEEAEVLAALTATANRLKTIGADPTNPIP